MKPNLAVSRLVMENRNFALLWAGQVVSSAGDWMAYVIVPLYILAVTHSTVAVGIQMACRVLPTIIVGPFSGVLADHFSKRKIMMSADAVRGLFFLVMPFAWSIWQIYGLTIMIAIGSTVFTPALKSYIPEIVAGEETMLANSALGFGQQAMMLLGPVAGGLLASVVGPKPALYVDAGSFFFSFVLLTLVPGGKGSPAVFLNDRGAKDSVDWFRSLRELVTYLGRVPDVLAVIITISIGAAGYGVQNVMFPLMAEKIWPAHGNAYGLIISFLGAGLALGSVSGGMINIKANLYIFFGSTLAISGLAFIIFGTARTFPVALTAIACVGFADGLNDVVNVTLLQTRVDRAYHGRIFAIQEALLSVPLLLGMIIAGFLAQKFSLTRIVIFAGGIVLASGLSYSLFTGRWSRRATAANGVPENR